MRSATREAIAATRAALAQGGSLTTGEELLAAGRVLGLNGPLRSALSDTAIPTDNKVKLVERVFASVGSEARSVLAAAVSNRWSSHDDLLAGLEEVGIRAIALSAPAGVDIVGELFTFLEAVASSDDLEFAVGSKLSSAETKVAIIEKLLVGKASEQTVAIVRHLVQQPRGRRIGALVRAAADIVADAAGVRIANVTAATPLTDAQAQRLAETLEPSYGKLHLNVTLDESIIGGVRVQIGDDVIDDSVASRLTALKLQLAG